MTICCFQFIYSVHNCFLNNKQKFAYLEEWGVLLLIRLFNLKLYLNQFDSYQQSECIFKTKPFYAWCFENFSCPHAEWGLLSTSQQFCFLFIIYKRLEYLQIVCQQQYTKPCICHMSYRKSIKSNHRVIMNEASSVLWARLWFELSVVKYENT